MFADEFLPSSCRRIRNEIAISPSDFGSQMETFARKAFESGWENEFIYENRENRLETETEVFSNYQTTISNDFQENHIVLVTAFLGRKIQVSLK